MPEAPSLHVLAIDIGGTFTDVVAYDKQTRRIRSGKAPTTPGGFAAGVLESIQSLAIDLGDVVEIVHGTTICTNTLIEGKQARTGFIGTKGFTDEFDIQRMIRRWGKTSWSSIYDLHQRKPPPYVPRHLRAELDERMTWRGEVLRPVDESEVRSLAGGLAGQQVEAIGVCLLWSVANPEHERQVRDLMRVELPDMAISISSDVAPAVREYERMVTTAVNASLMPVIGRYLDTIGGVLGDRGFRGALFLMQSHGGIADPSVVKDRPILTLRGGPVGGVIAAAALGRTLGKPRIISCDVGGTSCDTSLIFDHTIAVNDETDVNYYTVKVPTVDVQCIGAGGGSLAYVDSGGMLRVGPESAGSLPGPACRGSEGPAPR